MNITVTKSTYELFDTKSNNTGYSMLLSSIINDTEFTFSNLNY